MIRRAGEQSPVLFLASAVFFRGPTLHIRAQKADKSFGSIND
jgi:hypothetical protein